MRLLILFLVFPYWLLADTSNQAIFTHIYKTKSWGVNEEGEGYSGDGSLLQTTEQYRFFLQNFLKDHNINSVVDFGCGDWTFSQAIDWGESLYQGFDVVSHVIEKNKIKFETPRITFHVADGCRDVLPSADLLLCKDVLQHLSNKDVVSFLDNLQNYTYCLITNDVDADTLSASNVDITSGSYRHIDIRKPPFSIHAKPVLTFKSGPNIKQVLLVTSQKPKKTVFVHADPETARVFIAIIARNHEHVLPTYLDCIDKLDYNKKNISVYITTYNNIDKTEEFLTQWADAHKNEYESVEVKSHVVNALGSADPHEWTPRKRKALAKIKSESLQKAIEKNTDFYFAVNCDNYIAPQTLRVLIEKNRPIIAPMLTSASNDLYSNFFCAVSSNGYFASHPDYERIVRKEKKGTFNVPVVHCTYLVRKDVFSQVSYIDGTDDFDFVIFARSARLNGIPQYICNEQKFGTILHRKKTP